jgi:hypothetical protein
MPSGVCGRAGWDLGAAAEDARHVFFAPGPKPSDAPHVQREFHAQRVIRRWQSGKMPGATGQSCTWVTGQPGRLRASPGTPLAGSDPRCPTSSRWSGLHRQCEHYGNKESESQARGSDSLDYSAAMNIRPKTAEDEGWVRGLLSEHWGGTMVVAHGQRFAADRLPALVAGERAGLATYRFQTTGGRQSSSRSMQPCRGAASARRWWPGWWSCCGGAASPS